MSEVSEVSEVREVREVSEVREVKEVSERGIVYSTWISDAHHKHFTEDISHHLWTERKRV